MIWPMVAQRRSGCNIDKKRSRPDQNEKTAERKIGRGVEGCRK